MARKLLTMNAIRFIIESRNDPSKVYTWQDIADLVQTKFDIKVSGQAVGQSYKKYKDSFSSTTETVKLNTQHPVEFSGSDDHAQSRRRVGRGLHDGAEAGQPDAILGARAGRTRHPRRHSRRRVQCRHRIGQGHWRRDLRQSGRAQAVIHRLDPGRALGRPCQRRQQLQEAGAGTGRQEPHRGLCRCRF